MMYCYMLPLANRSRQTITSMTESWARGNPCRLKRPVKFPYSRTSSTSSENFVPRVLVYTLSPMEWNNRLMRPRLATVVLAAQALHLSRRPNVRLTGNHVKDVFDVRYDRRANSASDPRVYSFANFRNRKGGSRLVHIMPDLRHAADIYRAAV